MKEHAKMGQQRIDALAVQRYEGEFIDIVDPADVTEEELGLLMAGHSSDTESARSETGFDGGVQT